MVVVSITRHLPYGAARGTELWSISEAFRHEEFLLPSAKREVCPTVGTAYRLILKIHWMSSVLLNFS